VDGEFGRPADHARHRDVVIPNPSFRGDAKHQTMMRKLRI